MGKVFRPSSRESTILSKIESTKEHQRRMAISRVGRGSYPALVLVEDEHDMWLATVFFAEPPSPGMTFHFRGQVWQVFWQDDCGCRAEPAVM